MKYGLGLILFFLPQLVLASSQASGPHIQVSLVSEYQALVQGRQNWIGLYLQPENGWHTYWRNPGDSGEAPRIDWTLPKGVEAGQIHWPLPHAIDVAHLTNYGYEGANLLLVPVEVQVNQSLPVTLTADVSWLVCKEDCIPGWATLSLTLPVEAQPASSAWAALFEKTRQQLPASRAWPVRHELTGGTLLVSIAGQTEGNWQLFPLQADLIQHAATQSQVLTEAGLTLSMPVSPYLTGTPDQFEFLLSNGEQGYYLQSQLQQAPAEQSTSLFAYLLMALAGGLLLNIMPCVLPILCFKAMSLQRQEHRRRPALGYGIGVLVSFWLFALLVAMLKWSGQSVGWGFHLQNPLVIALLAYLFFIIGLMLLGSLPVGSGLAGMGDKLTRSGGFTGQFFTGVLAVVVASPCTAPFMAAALGIAMVSDLLTSLAIFTALGLGFALPMTLLTLVPAFNRWLPRPGPWMEHFRQWLAFPMFATCIWLLWIYQGQAGDAQQALLLLGLMALAMLCWQTRLQSRGLKAILGLAAIALVLLPLLIPAQQASSTAKAPSLASTFTLARLKQLREHKQVVLVNMTADWCISCKVNEQVAFADQQVQTALTAPGVHYLLGDWTNKNQTILEYLNRYRRSGVPLYVVYGGEQYVEVLPQLLTPQIVIDALNRAKQEI
ncbi:protein-disulfide reductase DsbD family protein [Bowmanella dokdonensis]|uniref:Thioredoxin family protein n=1 Tax=Bowmanella dokdonensis TaxID=751969 RepID=A0A939DRY1_9ALTE|nr:protein-disulfide reductase DsbD domain-containing protein [Bowmanella dokdonensis]MBN7826836.1 thioredoxin family protein [Bowmanella dokdonensis]